MTVCSVGMTPRLASLAFLAATAMASCKPMDEEPAPTVLRWDVTPSGADSSLEGHSFEGDHDKPIHAEAHRSCGGGVAGVGDSCETVDPGLEGEVDEGRLWVRVRDGWKMGANEVTEASYTPPGQTQALPLSSAIVEVTSFRPSTTISDSNKNPLLAWLCARGSADVTNDQGAVTGKLRFAIDYRNAAATDGDSPPCDADL
jgi:hypothetical protein